MASFQVWGEKESNHSFHYNSVLFFNIYFLILIHSKRHSNTHSLLLTLYSHTNTPIILAWYVGQKEKRYFILSWTVRTVQANLLRRLAKLRSKVDKKKYTLNLL